MPGGTLAVVDQAENNLKKLETYLTTGMDNTIEIALDIVEHSKGKSDSQLEELNKIMLEYVRMERELKHVVEATDYVKDQIRKNEKLPNLQSILKEQLNEKKQATQKDDLTEHPCYVDMQKKIEDMKAEDSTEAGKEPDTELTEDIAMTQQEMVTKCPYTGKQMKDPVTNKHCGHSYDREGIERAMKLRKGKTKCPVPACVSQKVIVPEDLEENKELRRHIETKQRKRGKKN